MGAEQTIKEKGIVLEKVPVPTANFIRTNRTGNLLFVGGHGPSKDGKYMYLGKVGRDVSIEEAQQAARLCGLNLLSSIRTALGSLDRVVKVVKATGLVNSAEGFGKQPQVIDGFSNLMIEVFGEAGRHARLSCGVAELPSNISVEVEMIVEVRD